MAENSKTKSTVKTELDEWGRKKFTIEEKSESEGEEAQATEAHIQKSLLMGREENLDIEKYVGRIEKNKKSKKKEVFHCEVCNEGFKCDLAYITHLNSPQHNRKLGMSMKVKAVSTESVVEKLKSMKKGSKGTPEEREMARFLEKAFVKREDKYKEQKQQEEYPEEEEEDEVNQEEEDVEAEMRALGLPTSFGSKKQKR